MPLCHSLNLPHARELRALANRRPRHTNSPPTPPSEWPLALSSQRSSPTGPAQHHPRHHHSDYGSRLDGAARAIDIDRTTTPTIEAVARAPLARRDLAQSGQVVRLGDRLTEGRWHPAHTRRNASPDGPIQSRSLRHASSRNIANRQIASYLCGAASRDRISSSRGHHRRPPSPEPDQMQVTSIKT